MARIWQWQWQMSWCRPNAWIVLAFALCTAGPVHSQALAQAPDGASELRERHQTLLAALRDNPFGRALHLDSTQASGDLKGEIHAVVEHPFETVRASLRVARHWCDILILHLNVKQCLSATGAAPSGLAVHVGRKFDQPLEEAYRVEFAYSVVADSAEFLHVSLRADNGPLGTRDYRITLRAIPLGDSRTFLNLSYAYGYGVAARLAMQAYLATLGSDKVGFSVVESARTASRCTWATCAAWWSATRCATTWRLTPTSLRSPRRRPSKLISVCATGSQRQNAMRASCTKWTRLTTWR